MRVRWLFGCCVVFIISLVMSGQAAAPVTAVQPVVNDVTLYTQNFAEIGSIANFSGQGSKSLRLPSCIEEDTVVIEEGGRQLAHTLTPVYTPIKGKSRVPVLQEYRAKVTGLSAGKHSLAVRYRVSDLGWNPNYSLVLTTPQQGTLRSTVSIMNGAMNLSKVTVRLVSGLVQTAGEEGEGYLRWQRLTQLMGGSDDIPAPATPGNIHEIQVLKNVTLAKDSSYQLPVQETQLKVEALSVWDASKIEGTDPAYDQQATAAYTLHNQTGRALAEGTVKVHQQGVLVGEGFLGWTTAGDTGTLVMAGVKDLTVKREDKIVPDPNTWENRKTTNLKVTNNGAQPVKVQVINHKEYVHRAIAGGYIPEPPAYTFNEVPETSSDHAFFWTITVPAHETHTITYAYSTPMDLGRFLMLRFSCDGSLKERSYIYKDEGSRLITVPDTTFRAVNGTAAVIYKLKLPAGAEKADLAAHLVGDFVLSLAPNEQGKPGTFQIIGRNDMINPTYGQYIFDLSPALSKSPDKVVYVKLTDAVQEAPGGPGLYDMELYRVPEGFPSRGRDYKAVAIPKPVETVSSEIPRKGTLLLSETFSESDLSGWITSRPEAKQSWRIRDGGLTPLRQGTGTESPGTELVSERSFPRDKVITCRWQPTNPTSYEFCVLFSHAKTKERYYQVNLWERSDFQYAGLWYIAEKSPTLTTAPLKIDGNAPHETIVEIADQQIRVWIDNNLLLEWTDTLGFLKEGSIGFRGGDYKLNSVQVHALAKKEKP